MSEKTNGIMGIKDGMWGYEHWVFYTTDQSLNTTYEIEKKKGKKERKRF